MKNPALLKVMVQAIYYHRGETCPEIPVDQYMAEGWAITAEQLKARCPEISGKIRKKHGVSRAFLYLNRSIYHSKDRTRITLAVRRTSSITLSPTLLPRSTMV